MSIRRPAVYAARPSKRRRGPLSKGYGRAASWSLQGRRSKYNARAVTIDGHRFASQAEAIRYGELSLLERAGKIAELVLQPKYPLKVNEIHVGEYVADFSYIDAETEAEVVEDVKGFKTPVYRLKRKLVQALYGIEIKEVMA